MDVVLKTGEIADAVEAYIQTKYGLKPGSIRFNCLGVESEGDAPDQEGVMPKSDTDAILIAAYCDAEVIPPRNAPTDAPPPNT